MSTILITGASGFVGKSLSSNIAKNNHRVICMSRKHNGLDLPWVRGEFSSFEDLRQLDKEQVDAVVHLAAVTGGCLERDGVLVNAEGTRCLMRYLMDRGCKKFVMASSIALVGFQSTKFRPVKLPIPDEHPCLDGDGYGFSKYLMEEITRYYCLQNESIDVINLRLASVCPDKNSIPLQNVSPLSPWCLGGLTAITLADTVNAFTLAAESKYKPGLRIMNAVASKSWSAVPVAEILANWWGNEIDLSHFKKPGHEFDSVYSAERIKQEIGFAAKDLPGN